MTYALGGYDTSPPLPELQGRHLGTAAQAGPVADTASANGLLALDDVSLSFGGVAALANIDLSVRRGEIRAIIGPNGAGKSSRVNVISGVYRRDRGHIQIGGKRYGNVPTEKLARLGIAARFSRKDLNHGFHHRRSWPLPHISALACTSSPPCRGLFRRPVGGSSYLFEAILLPFLALSLAGVGLNILTGYAGQVSSGSAAFMAVGAFAPIDFAALTADARKFHNMSGVYVDFEGWNNFLLQIGRLPLHTRELLEPKINESATSRSTANAPHHLPMYRSTSGIAS